MAERVVIRPSRPHYWRWTGLGLLIVLQVFLVVRTLLGAPTRLHCTPRMCWTTADSPFGEIVEDHRVSELVAGDDTIDFGRQSHDVERRFEAFLASPSGGFDAEYPDNEETALGLAVLLALLVLALVRSVRGSSVDIEVDRAASQVVVRRGPLMFGKRERRGKLEGARADIEVRKRYIVLQRRYLVLRSDYETLLDLRVYGKRDELAAVRALLQQPS